MSRLRLPEGTPWTCPGCTEPQVSLYGVPSEGTLCGSCSAPEESARPEPARVAGVPKKYRQGWDREQWRNRFGPIPSLLEEWDGVRTPALLWGKTGTGKSGLASILLLEGLAAAGSGLWIRGQAMIDGLRGGIGLGGGPEAQAAELAARKLLHRAKSAGILLLDDLFAGHAKGHGAGVDVSPWVLERVLAILAERYDEERPTLVTTMLTPVQIGAVDPSLASRLTDRDGVLCAFHGEDRR